MAHRLDRNYAEMLQELRVAQTGVQILLAFLLTIPFQMRFTSLDGMHRDLYVATLVLTATASVLLTAPVAAHRVMFRRAAKDKLVRLTAIASTAGLVCLGGAVLVAVLFVVSLVSGLGAGVGVAAALAVTLLLTWIALPVLAIWRGTARGRRSIMSLHGGLVSAPTVGGTEASGSLRRTRPTTSGAPATERTVPGRLPPRVPHRTAVPPVGQGPRGSLARRPRPSTPAPRAPQ
jgi:hypothetical protein